MEPCTVVSIMPYTLDASKPISPASFFLKAAERGDCEVLVIDYASKKYYVDHQRGYITIPEDPEKVAEAVVNDYIRGTIHIGDGMRPGLFYVKGAKTKDQIKRDHKKELENAERMQNAWFARLVKAGDDVWQKNRRHNVISEQHRVAAKYLGVKREWAEELKAELTVECAYCTSLISQKALVCSICRMPQETAIAALPDTVRDTMRAALGQVKPQVKTLG